LKREPPNTLLPYSFTDRKLSPLNLKGQQTKDLSELFDNLPKILRPEAAAPLLGISVKTIYDWRYRGKLRNVPQQLFLKVNRFLYLRTDILKDWISSQNPHL
jgi:hypothetical protein